MTKQDLTPSLCRDPIAATSESADLTWCGVRFLEYSASGPISTHDRMMREHSSSVEVYEDLLASGTGFGLTVDAECLRASGSFNKDLTCVEDTDLFLRLLKGGVKPSAVRSIEVFVHNHLGQRLTNEMRNKQRASECLWLLSQYDDFLNHYPSLQSQLSNHIRFLSKELRAA